MKKPDNTLSSVASISRELSVAMNTARDWVRLKDFPKRGKSGWNRAAVLKWYEDRQRKKAEKLNAAAESGDKKELKLARQCDLLLEQIRDRRLCADRVELENRKASGELMDVATVRAWASSWLARMVEAWRQAENAVNLRLSDRRAVEEVRVIFDTARNECSDMVNGKVDVKES